MKNAAIFAGGVVTGAVGLVGSFVGLCIYIEKKTAQDTQEREVELTQNIRISKERGWVHDAAYWQEELDKLTEGEK